MMNNIEEHVKTYENYVLNYAKHPSEDLLYQCSELGKLLAFNEFSLEEVVSLHQACLRKFTHLLTAQQVINSFDLLTEVTVQQSLWLKREIELKANAQCQISKQLLIEKSLISSFPDVLIKLSTELNLVEKNEHFSRIFGNKIIKNKTDFFSLFEQASDISDLLIHIENSELRSSLKMNLISMNNEILPCKVTIILLKDINHINDGFLCIIRDLRDLLEASAQLESAHQMIHDVIEAMPVRIYWKDIKQRYLGCNSAYLEDLGLEQSHCILHKTSEQISASFFNNNLEQQVLKQNIPFHDAERQITLINKEQIFIKEIIHPLKDLKGDIYGIICFYENINELKEKDKENQRLSNNLNQSQRLESIGRLAGGIAHDFNNMLSVILGYTQLMERDRNIFAQEDKCIDYLGRISAAADKAKLLTEKLLTFSRKQILQPYSIELYAHIKKTITTYSSIIEEDIFISLEGEDKYYVLADANQLDQVILNLLVNARDAMIEKKSTEQKQINLSLNTSDDNKYVIFTMKDTGVGIPEDIKNQIFEPFFTTKRDIGTGLGLATVFGIVTQNKGEIIVNSELGIGTEFNIYWPLNPNVNTITTDTKQIYKDNEFNKEHATLLICIVEDEEPVRKLMESVIHCAGYTVMSFESGELLFDYLNDSQSAPALLISDVILPRGENGKDIAELFLRIYPESKVMFVSGYSNDILSKRGIILEGVTYLKKPFDIDNLLNMVKQLLSTNNAIA